MLEKLAVWKESGLSHVSFIDKMKTANIKTGLGYNDSSSEDIPTSTKELNNSEEISPSDEEFLSLEENTSSDEETLLNLRETKDIMKFLHP